MASDLITVCLNILQQEIDHSEARGVFFQNTSDTRELLGGLSRLLSDKGIESNLVEVKVSDKTFSDEQAVLGPKRRLNSVYFIQVQSHHLNLSRLENGGVCATNFADQDAMLNKLHDEIKAEGIRYTPFFKVLPFKTSFTRSLQEAAHHELDAYFLGLSTQEAISAPRRMRI